jgi:hypothetical protein
VNNGEGSFIGPLLFVISSIIGILVAIAFPLDEGGEIRTTNGKLHVVLVMLMGILTMVGMIAMWLRLEMVEIWSIFASYSLVSAIVSLILFIISGIFIKSNYRGLLERLAVSTIQLYYFILALTVFLTN